MNCSTLGEIGVGLSASNSCTGMIFLFSPEVFENADTENKRIHAVVRNYYFRCSEKILIWLGGGSL